MQSGYRNVDKYGEKVVVTSKGIDIDLKPDKCYNLRIKEYVQLFTDLLQSGIVTVDFLMHRKENGMIRDHGFPFKILPRNKDLLFPKPIEYDLTK